MSERPLSMLERLLVPALALSALLVFLLAVQNGIACYGRPIAGVLVDPYAVVSGIQFSSWDGARLGLRFPDRIEAVDGTALAPEVARKRGDGWDEAVRRAAAEGRRTVHATITGHGASREVELGITRLSRLAWWAYGGTLFLAGALYVLVGLIALRVSPKGALARTFAKLACSAGVLLMTLLDFHTGRTLVPLFLIAFATLPPAIVALALRLPVDAPLLERRPWLARALDCSGLAAAAALVGTYALGRETTLLQAALTPVLGLAMAAFPVVLVTRYFRSAGKERAILRSLLVFVIPCALAAGFLLLASLGIWRSEVNAVSFPALALAPLSTVYAFVRHDLWGSRAILSRVTTLAVGSAVACAIATGLATALVSELGVPFRPALLTAGLAAALGGALVAAALIFGEKLVFPARAGYKPTIEQLSKELTHSTSPDEVAFAVERTVARWLPCDRIELVSADSETALEPIESWTGAALRDRDGVRLPLVFEGRALATLAVGAKRGGTLFTDDDVDLLRTIANQGALALAHALAYQELERRRREQASAWQGERLALVETMASEIAHEVRYPINFFRSLFDRGAQLGQLSGEDVEIGREEVERLERLVSGLRRVAKQSLNRQPTQLVDISARAEMLMRDALGERQLARALDERVVVSCDKDKVTQIVVNLLSNALDAAGPSGSVGVECRATEQGAELSVWDDGPGFTGDPMQLFAPWFTTKPRGTGLGLSISLRLARAHGWNVLPSRRAERTVFALEIPSRDIVNDARGAARNAAEVA